MFWRARANWRVRSRRTPRAAPRWPPEFHPGTKGANWLESRHAPNYRTPFASASYVAACFFAPMIVDQPEPREVHCERSRQRERPVPGCEHKARERQRGTGKHQAAIERERTAMTGAKRIEPLVEMQAVGPPDRFPTKRARRERQRGVGDEGQERPEPGTTKATHLAGLPRHPARPPGSRAGPRQTSPMNMEARGRLATKNGNTAMAIAANGSHAAPA